MPAPTPSKFPEEPEAPNPTISPPPAPPNPGGPSQSDPSEIPMEVSDGVGGAKAKGEGEDGEGEEDEAECGFCVFMKSGGCRDPFVAWERCVEKAERTREDVVDKCFEVTSLLKRCMDAHADYYAPILHAEAIAAAAAAAAADAEAYAKAKAKPQANTEPEPNESASKPKVEVRD